MAWFGRAAVADIQMREIDVRAARDRQERGALPGHLAALPRDRDVLLICRSGNRSGRALALLSQHGFDRGFNVAGGMLARVQAGLPITTGK